MPRFRAKLFSWLVLFKFYSNSFLILFLIFILFYFKFKYNEECGDTKQQDCSDYLNREGHLAYRLSSEVDYSYDLVNLTSYGYNVYRADKRQFVGKGSLLYLYQMKSSTARVSIEINSHSKKSDFTYATSFVRNELTSRSEIVVNLTKLDPVSSCRFVVRALLMPVQSESSLQRDQDEVSIAECKCQNGGICLAEEDA